VKKSAKLNHFKDKVLLHPTKKTIRNS